jgi:hypothetical protein
MSSDASRRIPVLIALAIMFALANALIAQPAERSIQPTIDERAQQAVVLCEQGRWEDARALLEQVVEDDPSHVAALYNLACAHAQLGDVNAALLRLAESIRAGFLNIEHLKRDSDLDPIRDTDGYRAILENWDAVVVGHTEGRIKRARARLNGRYIEDVDYVRNLIYVSGLFESSHRQMKKDVDALFDHEIRMLFDEGLNVPVLVVIPTPSDYTRVIAQSGVGGLYLHDHYQLITQDIGDGLFHELTHALHWAHMDRLGQTHQFWIQEGIACLFEDIAMSDGGVEFLPSWRTNIVHRLANGGRLTSWKSLFGYDRETFMKRPRRHYAEVRAIFMFLAEQNKLRDWYHAYIESFDDDATGMKAFEAVFDEPIRDIERSFRLWARDLEEAEEVVEIGRPSLGVTVNDRYASDGVMITAVHENTGAAVSDLRPGDVIMSMDGVSVRDTRDLTRELAKKKIGEMVKLEIRRGERVLSRRIGLTPR